MHYWIDAVQIIFLIAAAIAFALAGVVRRSRDKRGAMPLFVVNLSIGFRVRCLFATTVTGATLTVLALKLLYIPVTVNTAAMVVFIRQLSI